MAALQSVVFAVFMLFLCFHSEYGQLIQLLLQAWIKFSCYPAINALC